MVGKKKVVKARGGRRPVDRRSVGAGNSTDCERFVWADPEIRPEILATEIVSAEPAFANREVVGCGGSRYADCFPSARIISGDGGL